jgi:hypothetical protein
MEQNLNQDQNIVEMEQSAEQVTEVTTPVTSAKLYAKIRNIVLSMFALVFVTVMFYSASTFAFYSDEVASGSNKITMGNFDVEVLELTDTGSGSIPYEDGLRIVPALSVSKIVKAKTSDSVDATRYAGWYSEVALPDFPELTVSPESATWDGESNVVLTVTGGTVDSIRLNGQTVNTSNYTVSGTTVTLKATYLEGLTPGRKRFKLAAGSEKNVAFVLTIED